jgi:hypothetical protein
MDLLFSSTGILGISFSLVTSDVPHILVIYGTGKETEVPNAITETAHSSSKFPFDTLSKPKPPAIVSQLIRRLSSSLSPLHALAKQVGVDDSLVNSEPKPNKKASLSQGGFFLNHFFFLILRQ